MLIIAGLIAAVTAATTATTVVSVSAGIGITAAIAKKVADNIEEENYASIQRAKEAANHKIKSMVHENLQKIKPYLRRANVKRGKFAKSSKKKTPLSWSLKIYKIYE